jgi:competence protein ComEC
VTIAALVVLLFAPEAVVHPSFQMSFAATLALIAAYAHGLPLAKAGTDSSLQTRAALWGVNEVIGLVLASLVAGLATTPYAAYHFHRLAPYGVLANLLAMPVVSAWVMPMGLLGVLAIPFGFDGLFWRQMGYGIEWMDAVALWVASLPGAFGRVTSFGSGPLLLATIGLLLIGLLKTRCAGAAQCSSCWRSRLRRARLCPTFLSPLTEKRSRCVAPTAGFPPQQRRHLCYAGMAGRRRRWP